MSEKKQGTVKKPFAGQKRTARIPGKPPVKKQGDGSFVEGMNARRIALRVIRQVTEDGAYASLALDKALTGSGLNGPDRRLVSRLVYDTLDRLIYLDYCLDQIMARTDTDIKLRNILRLGACQILLEDRIPESAATNTAVQLCAETGMAGLKGVCNGILRNLVRKKDELVFPDPEAEPDLAASIRYSIPVWLWEKLKNDYGPEAGLIADFRRSQEGWTIRPNLTRETDASFQQILSKKIWGREKTGIPYAWRITGAMDIARDADFLAGRFSIQSPGSMLACLAVNPSRGQQILDCCAAPGGKSCFLSELMNGTGRVQAWDIHEHRVSLISAQAKRLGLENIRPMVRDATVFREDLKEAMDGVLLDAPCSGTGMLPEKPDLKLHLTEEGFRSLIELQQKLMDTVCGYVRPEGTFVYSTCSILKEENEAQVKQFLEKHPEFEPAPLPDCIPDLYKTPNDHIGVQLLEYRDHVEGFYFCRMRRKKNHQEEQLSWRQN